MIFFDGDCNVCNSSVQIIIRYDKNNIFKFTSLQSEIGKKLLQDNGYINDSINTIVFLNDNIIYTKSDAVIEICKLLAGYPKYFAILKIIPKYLRDHFYDLFAKYRYNLFGKKNNCMMPSPEIKNKFL